MSGSLLYAHVVVKTESVQCRLRVAGCGLGFQVIVSSQMKQPKPLQKC